MPFVFRVLFAVLLVFFMPSSSSFPSSTSRPWPSAQGRTTLALSAPSAPARLPQYAYAHARPRAAANSFASEHKGKHADSDAVVDRTRQ